MVIVSALTTPDRDLDRLTLRRRHHIALGRQWFVPRDGLLAQRDMPTSIVAPLAALMGLRSFHVFNNLRLQAKVRDVVEPAELGIAAGVFQAARFIGAGLAPGLAGFIVANDAVRRRTRRESHEQHL